MKRLLFVVGSLSMGGAEKCLAEMLRHVDLGRFEVTVLALAYEENMHQFDPRIRVINGYSSFDRVNLPISQFVPQALKRFRFLAVARKIGYWMDCRKGDKHPGQVMWRRLSGYVEPFEESFDAVIGYGQGTASFFAIDKVPRGGMKILWVNTDLVRARYDIAGLTEFYDRADRIVTVSENVRRNVANWFPDCREKISVFYDIIDNRTIMEKGSEPDPYPVNDKPRLLTVGRYCEAKALHLAIEAAAILAEKGMEFCWYLVGEGNLRPALEEQIRSLGLEDSVILTGMQSNPYPWFANCDLYVQSSVFEGSCTTLTEAMIFNKVVVTTDIEIAFEKIIPGKNGFICSQNGQAIAEIVEKLLTDTALKMKMESWMAQNPVCYGNQMKDFYDLLE